MPQARNRLYNVLPRYDWEDAMPITQNPVMLLPTILLFAWDIRNLGIIDFVRSGNLLAPLPLAAVIVLVIRR